MKKIEEIKNEKINPFPEKKHLNFLCIKKWLTRSHTDWKSHFFKL